MTKRDEVGIFINGPFGAGKSTVLDLVGDRLASRHVPFSLMDVDWFHRSSPPAEDDPDNALCEARNMAAVWKNYRSTGPRLLVVSGVIASEGDLRRYEQAVGLGFRIVRLDVSQPVAMQRLRNRYLGSRPDTYQWHVDNWTRIAQQITAANLSELVIDAEKVEADSVADEVVHFADRLHLLD